MLVIEYDGYLYRYVGDIDPIGSIVKLSNYVVELNLLIM